MNGKFDAMLSFGELAVTSGTQVLPDVLDLNKSSPVRCRVAFWTTEAFAGGTSIVVKVQGSNNNSDFTDVAVTPSIPLAELKADANFDLAIPESWKYKYMRVTVVSTGTFTGGKMMAALDCYQGV